MKKAILLDRDGILNAVVLSDDKIKITPPYKKSDLKICYKNIKYLNLYKNFYLFFIITNQPDIKKGIQSYEFNEYINRRITKLINIKEIFSCLCLEDDKNCDCYKPRPGMLLSIKKKWKINLKESFLIGDRWRDIGAGKSVGCKTILLKTNYNNIDLTLVKPDYIVKNIKEINKIIPLN